LHEIGFPYREFSPSSVAYRNMSDLLPDFQLPRNIPIVPGRPSRFNRNFPDAG
jgi:hypothetical protein